MAYLFGDGFDCYAAVTDAFAGYWDGGSTTNQALVAGRFTGSQAISYGGIANNALVKSSGSNDAVHHIVVAVRQTGALVGTSLGLYFQFSDAATNQCCIVFRQDGVVLLTSATPAGTTLATYSGALTAQNTWFAFEFEVVISNTVGRFRARKNGNTVDDFDSGATLNTRPGTNSYANKLTVGQWSATGIGHQFDDILWRSDASSVPWVGDVRCYSRMPASDVSVQFSLSPNVFAQVINSSAATGAITSGTARATPFSPTYSGLITGGSVRVSTGGSGHIKVALYDNSTNSVLLATSSEITNPTTGDMAFTFPSPPSVVRGTTYRIAIDQDFSVTYNTFTVGTSYSWSQTYAGFAANPAVMGTSGAFGQPMFSLNITPTSSTLVSETLQDGTTSYVYDSNVNDADFYNISPLSGTPASTIAVITRGFLQKSDAGTRGAAVQLRSGASTVQSTPTLLSTSWGWLYRVDTVDPATGSAWTAAAVSNVTIGPVVTS